MTDQIAPTRKGWAAILALSLFWFVFICAFGSRHATLSTGWADKVSNLYSSWIIWDHGLEVFRVPTQDYLRPLADPVEQARLADELELPVEYIQGYQRRGSESTDAVFIAGTFMPRPYPPGAYLYFAPFSFLMSQNWVSAKTATFFLVAVGLVVTHLAIFFLLVSLWRLAPPKTRVERFLMGAGVFIAYAEALRWSLNSQFDMLAVLFILLFVISAQIRRPFVALLQFALAVFCHLRAVMFLPYAVWVFVSWLRDPGPRARISRLKITHWLALLAAMLMVTLAALDLFWNAPYFKMAEFHDLNSMHYSKLIDSSNLERFLVFAIGYMALVGFWVRRRMWLVTACSFWAVVLLMQSHLMREWYALFLLPFFLIAIFDWRNAQVGTTRATDQANPGLAQAWVAVLLFYTLVSAIFMNNSPFEFRLIREAAEAIGR